MVAVDVGVNDGGGLMGVVGGFEGLFVEAVMVLLYGQRAGDGLGSGSGLIPGWVWVCELPRPRPGLSSGSCMLSCPADAWAELKVCEPPRQEPGLSSGSMGGKGKVEVAAPAKGLVAAAVGKEAATAAREGAAEGDTAVAA